MKNTVLYKKCIGRCFRYADVCLNIVLHDCKYDVILCYVTIEIL
jgi:hypothetical protein